MFFEIFTKKKKEVLIWVVWHSRIYAVEYNSVHSSHQPSPITATPLVSVVSVRHEAIVPPAQSIRL